jgi:hypothetical protein
VEEEMTSIFSESKTTSEGEIQEKEASEDLFGTPVIFESSRQNNYGLI